MDYSPQSISSSLPYNTSVTQTMSVADDVKTQHVRLFNPVTPDISPPPQIGSGVSSSMKGHEPLVRKFHLECFISILIDPVQTLCFYHADLNYCIQQKLNFNSDTVPELNSIVNIVLSQL